MPGKTDGGNLIHTITDLSRLYPGVSSVGVVPIGKSKYLKGITRVSPKLAQQTVRLVDSLHTVFRRSFGKGFVYLADEFYLTAGASLPERWYYDDFPQLENGIGMIRQFVDEINSLYRIKRIKGKFLILTGTLAFPFITMLKKRLTRLHGIDESNIDVRPVENRIFGKTVTVSGLLGSRDFRRVIQSCRKRYDRIILPPNCLNDTHKFIDDVPLNDERIIVSPHSIKELLTCLQ
jgi:NifB/MoaA-like Fe-S oxidoreductase